RPTVCTMGTLDDTLSPPDTHAVDLLTPPAIESLPGLDRPLTVQTRELPLLGKAPWVRTLGKLSLEVTTQGWRFPPPLALAESTLAKQEDKDKPKPQTKERTRLQP